MTRDEIADRLTKLRDDIGISRASLGDAAFVADSMSDEVRALPVLRTCGECAYCVTDLHVGEWCDRDEQQRDTERESPPPSWCPLRGAR